jgi:hypothetical protein
MLYRHQRGHNRRNQHKLLQGPLTHPTIESRDTNACGKLEEAADEQQCPFRRRAVPELVAFLNPPRGPRRPPREPLRPPRGHRGFGSRAGGPGSAGAPARGSGAGSPASPGPTRRAARRRRTAAARGRYPPWPHHAGVEAGERRAIGIASNEGLVFRDRDLAADLGGLAGSDLVGGWQCRTLGGGRKVGGR